MLKTKNNATKIYPNPVTDDLNISLSDDYILQDKIEIKILDMNSKIIISQTITNTNNIAKIINLQTIVPATYLLEVKQNEKKETFKFTKE